MLKDERILKIEIRPDSRTIQNATTEKTQKGRNTVDKREKECNRKYDALINSSVASQKQQLIRFYRIFV
jgi:hypothetical protein